MANINFRQISIFLEAGAQGVLIGPNGPSSWRTSLAFPLVVGDQTQYGVAVSSCVLKTPAVANRSVFIASDLVAGSLIGGSALQVLAQIPPNLAPVNTWPVSFTFTASVPTFQPLAAANTSSVEVVFNDSTGAPIVAAAGEFFSCVLVVKRL